MSASLKKLAFIDAKIARTRFLLSSETSNKDDFCVVSLVFWLTGQGRSKSAVARLTQKSHKHN